MIKVSTKYILFFFLEDISLSVYSEIRVQKKFRETSPAAKSEEKRMLSQAKFIYMCARMYIYIYMYIYKHNAFFFYHGKHMEFFNFLTSYT